MKLGIIASQNKQTEPPEPLPYTIYGVSSEVRADSLPWTNDKVYPIEANLTTTYADIGNATALDLELFKDIKNVNLPFFNEYKVGSNKNSWNSISEMIADFTTNRKQKYLIYSIDGFNKLTDESSAMQDPLESMPQDKRFYSLLHQMEFNSKVTYSGMGVYRPKSNAYGYEFRPNPLLNGNALTDMAFNDLRLIALNNNHEQIFFDLPALPNARLLTTTATPVQFVIKLVHHIRGFYDGTSTIDYTGFSSLGILTLDATYSEKEKVGNEYESYLYRPFVGEVYKCGDKYYQWNEGETLTAVDFDEITDLPEYSFIQIPKYYIQRTIDNSGNYPTQTTRICTTQVDETYLCHKAFIREDTTERDFIYISSNNTEGNLFREGSLWEMNDCIIDSVTTPATSNVTLVDTIPAYYHMFGAQEMDALFNLVMIAYSNGGVDNDYYDNPYNEMSYNYRLNGVTISNQSTDNDTFWGINRNNNPIGNSAGKNRDYLSSLNGFQTLRYLSGIEPSLFNVESNVDLSINDALSFTTVADNNWSMMELITWINFSISFDEVPLVLGSGLNTLDGGSIYEIGFLPALGWALFRIQYYMALANVEVQPYGNILFYSEQYDYHINVQKELILKSRIVYKP